MGSVFRKTYTKPIPAGAEFFTRSGERLARWKDAKGKKRTAAVTIGKDGSERIVIESPYYIAKYRDGHNNLVEESTGCKDADAARSVLGDLERRAVLVKSKVISGAEDAIAEHQPTALNQHLVEFSEHLESEGTTEKYREETIGRLKRIAGECGFSQLGDLNRQTLERWLVQFGKPKQNGNTTVPAGPARTMGHPGKIG